MSNNRINNSEKVVIICITDAKGKVNANNLPAQDSWFLLYSGTSDEDKMISPGRQVPASMHVYDFLDKDSMVQCEEIRAVSKSSERKVQKGIRFVKNGVDRRKLFAYNESKQEIL